MRPFGPNLALRRRRPLARSVTDDGSTCHRPRARVVIAQIRGGPEKPTDTDDQRPPPVAQLADRTHALPAAVCDPPVGKYPLDDHHTTRHNGQPDAGTRKAAELRPDNQGRFRGIITLLIS